VTETGTIVFGHQYVIGDPVWQIIDEFQRLLPKGEDAKRVILPNNRYNAFVTPDFVDTPSLLEILLRRRLSW
jgi:hypothetical protein